MGPGILPETTVSKHNPPMAHLQMPTKALSRKKEAICERGAEALSSPVSQGSFKKEMFQSGRVFYGQTSPNFTFLLEITDTVSSELKKRETLQCVISISSKASISDGMEVHKFIRYGQLACFGRHYECWKVYKVFRATYAPLQTTCISAGQCKTTFCSYYNSMAL